jgi:hypothetical protein
MACLHYSPSIQFTQIVREAHHQRPLDLKTYPPTTLSHCGSRKDAFIARNAAVFNKGAPVGVRIRAARAIPTKILRGLEVNK